MNGLPDRLKAFIAEHHLDPKIFAASPPRYIRVTPLLQRDPCEWELYLKQHLSDQIKPVAYAPHVFALPGDLKLAQNAIYKKGEIAGIDLASVFAVDAMDIQACDHVLDLCCAPGPKMAYACEQLGGHGSITGIDISPTRIQTCKKILSKYVGQDSGKSYRLICADASQFKVPPPRPAQFKTRLEKRAAYVAFKRNENTFNHKKRYAFLASLVTEFPTRIDQPRASVGRLTTSASPRQPQYVHESSDWAYPVLPNDSAPANEEARDYYDKVLVDAECSTDGSVRHTIKHIDKPQYLPSTEKLESLCELQLSLLIRGFEQCKPGSGELVYATCSLLLCQNELVVYRFLSKYRSQAQLIDLSPRYSDLLLKLGKDLEAVQEHDARQLKDLETAVSSNLSPVNTVQSPHSKRARLEHPSVCLKTLVQSVLRFNPLTTNTSGLFVAKFKRISA